MQMEQGFQISELMDMARRRMWLITAVAGGCVLLAIFLSSILRNEYQSSATILVEPQTISQRLVESGVPERDINSRLHLIQMQILSRGRLSRIIDELGLYQEEAQELTREEVIEMMRDKIAVAPLLSELEAQVRGRTTEIDISTFQISFRHTSPRIAADVANRLANDFIDEHIKERVQISGDTSEFIEAELNRLATRIAEVEDRIAGVKSENAGRLPEDMSANQRLLERALEGIRAAERDLTTARSDQSFYNQQALASSGLSGTPGVMSPAQRVEVLELALGEYRARRLTDKHPDVQSTQREIASLRAQLAESGEDGAEVPLSLAQQSAQAEAERAGMRAAAAQAELDRLQAQAAELETRLAGTPRVAEQLASLEREHEHLFKSYQDFSNKRLEAGVAANMERRQKGEQFRVLEAAYPANSPVSPNRPLIMAIGILFGLLIGAAVALLLEVSDTSFRRPRSLQEALRIPVLASVSAVVLESDRIARRRAAFRRIAAATAVTGLVIVASVAGNWMVNGAPGPVQELLGGEEQAAPVQAPPPAAPGAAAPAGTGH